MGRMRRELHLIREAHPKTGAREEHEDENLQGAQGTEGKGR